MPPLVSEKLPELQELCRRFGVLRLELFGSAANGRFNPATSDLDFVADFDDTPSTGWDDNYFSLLAALEQLFRRKVDLVERKAIRSAQFKANLEQHHELIYARTRQPAFAGHDQRQ